MEPNDQEHQAYPDVFHDAAELVRWYERYGFFHRRLARLVAQFLHLEIGLCFEGIDLPVLARITHREKHVDSLLRNLHSRPERYCTEPSSCLIGREQVRDLAGVRAVFYFYDQVDTFAERLKPSIVDKFGPHAYSTLKKREDPDTGYRSWHFVVNVQKGTKFYNCLNKIDQYYLYGLFCETQLRTILQEAWAEAEHDILYKAKQEPNAPSALLIKTFTRLSDRLDDIDHDLVKLKAEYENTKLLRGSKSDDNDAIRQHWHYKQPALSGAETYNDIEYPYELLHCSKPGNGLDIPFHIESNPVLFDVDEEMSPITGGIPYKERVWVQLEREEPEFIDSITNDSVVVRATDWDGANNVLSVQLATYSDQVVTNHKKTYTKIIPGTPDKQILSLAFRPIADQNGRPILLPLRESPLSNTLGIASIVLTADESWLIGLRTSALAFDPNLWGCSASGALNWTELGHWRTAGSNSWMKSGVIRENREGTWLSARPDEVHYLGLAREFGRLGKPQIFFLIRTSKSGPELITTFRTYRQDDSRFLALKYLTARQAQTLIGKDETQIRELCGNAGVSEELRFNLYLALRYTNKLQGL